MSTVLVIIDIQRDYFPGGAFPLVAPEPAAANAGRLLARFRDRSGPIVHIRHASADGENFMQPGTEGFEFHPDVAPAGGETVITKAHPNSFRDTPLLAHLIAAGASELVVAGMMTSMCGDATVRAAADLGFGVTVAADACAAPDLEFGGTPVAGAQVHAAFLAALADSYATVSPTDAILAADRNGRAPGA
jgi:nicotinamidase-related amidase